jgi:hypothetical protein
VLLCVIIFSSLAFSQENKGSVELDESGFSAFDSKEKYFQFLSETYFTSKKEIPFENVIQSRSLNIRQIGDYNNLNVNLKGAFIKVDILQNGANNQLELDKEANAIKQKVVQDGQNNSIKDLSIYANNNVNMEFIQQGNNQNIQNYGTNSISENMKVIQSGNGAAVIIINNK